MNRLRVSTIILLASGLLLLGAGCFPNMENFPPKPPVPGIQQSPLIDRLTP